MVPFWLFGAVMVAFPSAVWRFYRWFHGPALEDRIQPRHVRNAGVFWLIVMAITTYFR